MSSPAHAFRTAVHALFIRSRPKDQFEILLGLRQNTGYGDGCYSFPAGHQELFETSLQALVRESYEEVGAHVALPNNTPPVLHIEHLKDYGSAYADPARRFRHYHELFYIVPDWMGEPQNCEPDKCGDLRFFSSNHLPHNLMPLTRFALELIVAGQEKQARFGWDNPDFPAWRKKHFPQVV